MLEIRYIFLLNVIKISFGQVMNTENLTTLTPVTQFNQIESNLIQHKIVSNTTLPSYEKINSTSNANESFQSSLNTDDMNSTEHAIIDDNVKSKLFYIRDFDDYRIQIALATAFLLGVVFSASMLFSSSILCRGNTDIEKSMKKKSENFPQNFKVMDPKMNISTILSVYQERKADLTHGCAIDVTMGDDQRVHRDDQKQNHEDLNNDDSDDEVIYQYRGPAKVVDLQVVNPFYFLGTENSKNTCNTSHHNDDKE